MAEEIPFWFHDRPKWVSGITRHTTCQDIIHSLVKTHLAKGYSNNSKTTAQLPDLRSTCQQLVLVEQWRGVERPLSNSSRILKLWQAWGEEQGQVKFIVKRIVNSNSDVTARSNLAINGNSASHISSHRKTRRRNSKLTSSRSSLADTVHPSALIKQHSTSTSDIERLMRIILTQGETIHSQLKKLQEREGQIESIEEEVHEARTKTAGKNYLLKAYLENLSDGDDKKKTSSLSRTHKVNKKSSDKIQQQASASGSKRPVVQPVDPDDLVPEHMQEMLDVLSRVQLLNDKLENTEETLCDLHCKLTARSRSADPPGLESRALESTRSEISKLRCLNDQVGKEIDHNHHLIRSMQSAFDERKALVVKLENDVVHIESEGLHLQRELQRMTDESAFDPTNLDLYVNARPAQTTSGNNDDVEDDLMKDIMNDVQYQLSNSDLYEDAVPPAAKLYERLQGLHVKTGLDLLNGQSSSCTDSARINATGSPGSSTSGNSSSGCGTGSEQSAPSSGREGIMATPELPPIPGEFPHHMISSSKNSKMPPASSSVTSQYTKSILKAVDPSGDLDSNSDTGLSSLHSSSDEGTYVLDTLV